MTMKPKKKRLSVNGFMLELIRLSTELFEKREKREALQKAKRQMYFKPPFRVGKKQLRAILDSKGRTVYVFPRGQEKEALNFCHFLNSK